MFSNSCTRGNRKELLIFLFLLFADEAVVVSAGAGAGAEANFPGVEKVAEKKLPPAANSIKSKLPGLDASGAHSINNRDGEGDTQSEDGSTGDWGDNGEARVPSENSVDTDVTTDTENGSNGTPRGRRPASVAALEAAAKGKGKQVEPEQGKAAVDSKNRAPK